MNADESILQIRENGYCVLKGLLSEAAIHACREAFWPILLAYLEHHAHEPNRGPQRHYLPMPFTPPCFQPEFFFHPGVLDVVRGLMGSRIVADQWGCDVPLSGSDYQPAHVDFQRPLFEESPGLVLPPYILVVSFGLVPIAAPNGTIEIAPGTHRLPREAALRSLEARESEFLPIPLDLGDVLIRHPWAWHRGSPNTTGTPRALVSVRYVRRWYADTSRDVRPIARALWGSLTREQQELLRFPVAD